ncbi:Uncharacterized protein FWK35_00003090 [Aphis craccivora]|uniref:Uncharacterized protein n=1 Tax=Aphis craccivora TaxID=307492 RepID=A0A6G0Z6L8_APHCR|nr:Uncharacterized protein FWK35_00003090 [Aphis craccivora]
MIIGKFDNFVGSRKKSSSNTTIKINNDIPILPDADENIDADLLYSVKPAELHSRMTESAYEDETMRPPINLPDIDLGLLFSNMTRKHHLEDVGTILLLLGLIFLYNYYCDVQNIVTFSNSRFLKIC